MLIFLVSYFRNRLKLDFLFKSLCTIYIFFLYSLLCIYYFHKIIIHFSHSLYFCNTGPIFFSSAYVSCGMVSFYLDLIPLKLSFLCCSVLLITKYLLKTKFHNMCNFSFPFYGHMYIDKTNISLFFL